MKGQEKGLEINIWCYFKRYFSVYDFSMQIVFAVMLGLMAFVLDFYNIPSHILIKTPIGVLGAILCAFGIFLVVWLLQFHAFDLFAISSENPLDVASFITIIASIFYTIVRSIVLGLCIYIWVAVVSFFVAIFIFTIRLLLRYDIQKKFEKNNSNLIDLKALYENDFTRIAHNPILLSERAVDYDLLDRNGIIDKLYNSIKYCRPEESYVISLEGEWGTGKTTIINITKQLLLDKENNEKEYIIIDDFDPWLYGTQNSLLLAMFETIIKHTGLKYSPIRSNLIVTELCKTVVDNHAIGGILSNLFYDTRKHTDDIFKLKMQIRNYIRTQNKPIVFFIDNLDRANDANVIFLFKLIGIVFDLPGIIYILSFERERIDLILRETKDFDSRFLEKIIQQEIKVPAISSEKVTQLYFVCIENLLISYGISKEEVIDFKGIARYIVSMTQNIRSFKRMINSVFSVVFCDDSLLDKRDLLAIEVIHFYDPLLYTSIYRNSQYFISHERNFSDSIDIVWNIEEFNKKAKKYFSEIFDSREDAKELLSGIFPYVDRYNKNQPLEQKNSFPDLDLDAIVRKSRVCDARYFDLYFSYTTNNSLRIRESVETYIANINSDDDIWDLHQGTQMVICTMEYGCHREWFEQLQRHISDIRQEKIYDVAVVLYSLIYSVNPEKTIWGVGLGPRSRVEYIISELLLKCNEEEFNCFLRMISLDYGKIGVINSIFRWMNTKKHDEGVIRRQRAETFRLCYSEICERVTEEKINIYADRYYYAGNSWGIYYHFKDINTESIFTSYIKSILSSENIYKILWDIKSCIIGDSYIYSLSEDNLSIYLGDIEVVKSLIMDNPPKNEDEEFVYQMYDVYCNGQPDEWGHKGVVSETAVNLNL